MPSQQEVIKQIREKYGDHPLVSEKGKQLKKELEENAELVAQLKSLKKR